MPNLNLNHPKVFVTMACTAFFALAFALACTRGSAVVAEVGGRKIEKRDVDFRNKIIRVYSPEESRDLGLQQLVNAYVSAAVLENNGHRIDRERLKAEAERIDKTTLAPDQLQKIRAVFGGDEEAYLRDFVLPVYAERVIYFEFFLQDKTVQASSFERAKKLQDELRRDPTRFAEIAKKSGYQTQRLSVSAKTGLQWGTESAATRTEGLASAPPQIKQKLETEASQQALSESKKWIGEIAKRLKPGQIEDKVIDIGEAWILVRYLGPSKRDPSTYEFETVRVSKEDYAAWRAKENSKVKVLLKNAA